jgi:hypothetical protein
MEPYCVIGAGEDGGTQSYGDALTRQERPILVDRVKPDMR